jgi:hypothetical protein
MTDRGPGILTESLSLSLFLISFFSSEDIHGLSLCLTSIIVILDPLTIAPWKTLSIDQYNKYGADKIWMLDKYKSQCNKVNNIRKQCKVSYFEINKRIAF